MLILWLLLIYVSLPGYVTTMYNITFINRREKQFLKLLSELKAHSYFVFRDDPSSG